MVGDQLSGYRLQARLTGREESSGRGGPPAERGRVLAAVGLTAVAILALLVVALRMSEGGREPPPAGCDPRSLAVMPFQSLVPDPDTDYLGVGLADTIINHLSRVPGLTVRPMSSALEVASDQPDPVEAGRRLHASAVMVGRYRRDGTRLQVTVQLVDAGSGFALWGHRFETTADDLMQIERMVANETVAALMPGLKDALEARDRPRREPAAGAYYLYVLARGKLATFQTRPLLEAVDLLEQAISADPDFAPAHAALSQASANMFLGGLSTDAAWMDRALASGRRAVFLDEADPAGHYALGYALLFTGDPAGSARATIRALELDPEHTLAQRQLARLLAGAGATAQARALCERAHRSGPGQGSGWLETYLAVQEGTVEETVESFTRELEVRKAAGRSVEYPAMQLGYLSFENGDAAAALRWAAILEQESASRVYADIIALLALARAGDGPAVERLVTKHRDVLLEDWTYSLWVGRALAMVGRLEEALYWLENSARRGCYDLLPLETSADLDPLRGQRRFQEALSAVRSRAAEIIRLAQAAGYG